MTLSAVERPPRLSAWRRARRRVRRSLFVVLRVVPTSLVGAVHTAWIDATGVRRAALRPLAALLYYRPIDRTVITVPGGAGERLPVVGSRLERVLWWYGEAGYESAEAALWRRLCARSSRVLEIGANVGYYTAVGARACPGRYTAVEALPEAVTVLRRTLDLNALDHVTVVAGAVTGTAGSGEIELALPDQEAAQTAPTGGYLRTADGAAPQGLEHRAASRTVRVATVASAPLFAGVDLAKLDIEGSEAEVLAAARAEVLAARPVLLVEVLAGSSALRALLRDLLGHGWRAFDVRPELRPTTLAETGPHRDRDVLLVPEERLDDL